MRIVRCKCKKIMYLGCTNIANLQKGILGTLKLSAIRAQYVDVHCCCCFPLYQQTNKKSRH